jgi:FtsH-binding integral membrane protein
MYSNNPSFEFSGDALQAAGQARLSYVRKVYSYFGLGLLAAAAGSLISMNSGIVYSIAAHPIIAVIAFIATFFFATASANNQSRALPALLLFTFVNGTFISPLLYAIASGYIKGTGPGLIYNALFLTILIFAALTTYVFISKKDFSYIGATLTIGIFMVFGALLVNMFVQSSSLDLALSIIIVILFSGFVLFDTSRILKRAHEIPPTLGALSLYLDFMNIFLALIRILGGGRRD